MSKPDKKVTPDGSVDPARLPFGRLIRHLAAEGVDHYAIWRLLRQAKSERQFRRLALAALDLLQATRKH